MELQWIKFNALGTTIIIAAFLEKKQLNKLKKAEKIVQDFEKRFSRFIKKNELDRLNASSGKTFRATKMMVDLVMQSKKMFLKTGGTFDPTAVKSLEQLGYDKNYLEINNADQTIDIEKIKTEFLKRPTLKDIEIEDNKISTPKGFKIDFGGIGKGYITDYLSKNVFHDVKNFWISAGGDLLLKGNDANSNGWKIAVQNPQEPEKEIFFVKSSGEEIGIATSGIIVRHGTKGGFKWHHLIDPRTGLPAENDILSVTAISTSAQNADIFGKTVLILGEKEGLDFIEKQKNSACIIFFKNKELVMSKNMLKYF